MSHFRSIFRLISENNSYQVSDYGPKNNKFYTFLPSDITGLRTWIDVSDSTVVTSSGGYIDAITNKGSLACTFRPVTVTQRPFISASSINSRNSAGFDGVDDILSSSVSAANCFGLASQGTTANFTIGFVLKPNRINTSAAFPFNADTILAQGNASLGFFLGTSFGSSERLWFDYASTDSINWVRTNSSQIAAGTTFCAVVRMLTKSYDLYVNGTFVSGVIRTFDPTIVNGSLRIGNEIFPSNGGAAKIDLCEMVIYTGTLSPTEISTLTSYFQDRWGIT